MIDLFELYNDFCQHVNTHQNGTVRPQTTFLSWVNDAQDDIFNNYKKAFEDEEEVSDALRPFIRSVNSMVRDVPGEKHDLALFPKDYHYFLSARLRVADGATAAHPDLQTYSWAGEPMGDEDEQLAQRKEDDANISMYPLEKTTNSRWTAVCNRRTLKASISRGYCTLSDKGDGLKVLPKGVGIIQMDYLRLPLKGTMAYRIVDEGQETERMEYNLTQSQQLEWDRTIKPEFLQILAVKYYQFIGK